jgi:transposase
MAIDETGLVNGELYTIVLNKDARGRKGSIAALIKGTKGKDIANAITNSVPFSTRMKIKEITLDMANNMNWIVRQIAPNAIRTYDRFHVQQIVSDAVQTIRVHFRWEAINQDNEAVARAKELGIKYSPKIFTNGDTKKQLLARSRYFLFKSQDKWTDTQKTRAEILFAHYPTIATAYKLYIQFKNSYIYNNNKYNFADWIKVAYKSGIKEIVSAAKTIETHLTGIENYFINRATNAAIEGFHAKLKLFRQRIRGINDKDFFFFRILQYYA